MTPFHGQNRCPRPQGWAQAFLQCGQRGWIEAVCPADQHQIGGFELFFKQFLNGRRVIQAWIGQALGLKGFRVRHHMAGRQGLAILLQLNRTLDKGIAVAVVGYTDALVATLFVQSGVPAPDTEYDAAEVERQLASLEAELASVTKRG